MQIDAKKTIAQLETIYGQQMQTIGFLTDLAATFGKPRLPIEPVLTTMLQPVVSKLTEMESSIASITEPSTNSETPTEQDSK
jgi:hypothetical protein